MSKAAQYRVFAEECRELAKTMRRDNKEKLLKIAEAWEKVAEELNEDNTEPAPC